MILKPGLMERKLIQLRCRCSSIEECTRWVSCLQTAIEASIGNHHVNLSLEDPDSPFLKPKKRKCLFIINPVSGRRKGEKIFKSRVEPILKLGSQYFSYTLKVTQTGEDAYNWAFNLDISQYDTISTISGDGTLWGVLNGLLHRPDWWQVVEKVTLAPIAGGTGNAMAASVSGIHFETQAFHILKHSHHPLDIMALQFVNSQHKNVLFSFLDFSYAFVSDSDFESETMRWAGSLRNTLYGVRRLLDMRRYLITFAFKPATGSELSHCVSPKPSLSTIPLPSSHQHRHSYNQLPPHIRIGVSTKCVSIPSCSSCSLSKIDQRKLIESYCTHNPTVSTQDTTPDPASPEEKIQTPLPKQSTENIKTADSPNPTTFSKDTALSDNTSYLPITATMDKTESKYHLSLTSDSLKTPTQSFSKQLNFGPFPSWKDVLSAADYFMQDRENYVAKSCSPSQLDSKQIVTENSNSISDSSHSPRTSFSTPAISRNNYETDKSPQKPIIDFEHIQFAYGIQSMLPSNLSHCLPIGWEVIQGSASIILTSLLRYQAHDLQFTPYAHLSDGSLDCFFLGSHVPKSQLLYQFGLGRVESGDYINHLSSVRYFKCTEFVFVPGGRGRHQTGTDYSALARQYEKEPAPKDVRMFDGLIGIDGEMFEPAPLCGKVYRGLINVICARSHFRSQV